MVIQSPRQYNAEQLKAAEAECESIHTNIERLHAQQAEEQRILEEGRSGLKAKLLKPFGKGELAEAKKSLKAKDDEIAKLKSQLAATEKKIAEIRRTIGAERDGYKREINAAISRAERAEAACEAKDRRIEQLDRQLHPERYRLSSGARLTTWWIPNRLNPTLSIWTMFHGEEGMQVATPPSTPAPGAAHPPPTSAGTAATPTTANTTAANDHLTHCPSSPKLQNYRNCNQANFE